MRQSTDVRYLIVPGWQGSSAEHWQSHWQQVLPPAHGLSKMIGYDLSVRRGLRNCKTKSPLIDVQLC